MAGSISSVLQQAKSALAANQVAMTTTAKNVSNVNTEGYSRQRVELVTGTPEELGQIRLGGGVDVGNVSRSTNEFVQNRLIEENSTLGKYQGLTDIYAQLEVVFHEDGEGSVTQAVSQFFNNLRTLSTQPDSVPVRTAVKEAASTLTHRFNAMSTSIDQIVGDVDARIDGAVSEINRLSEKIANLNAQIVSYEVKGGGVTANDERDQRDMAILELSKLIDVKTTKLENGGLNVSSANMGPIVMGPDRIEFAAARAPAGPNPNAMRVFMVSPYNTVPPKDVSEKFVTGQLGGLLSLRDQVIPEMRDKVDGLAYNLSSSINDIHENAFTRTGKQGVLFFERPPTVKGAAEALRLSEEVDRDVGNIATSQVANAAGDNRALLQMTALETEKIFEGGQRNFNDIASSIVGSLGAQVRSANDNLETQRGVVEQLDVVKKSASSVSLDEEAMNMLKFQKAFDANAKMIQVADQMMDTIVNLKRF